MSKQTTDENVPDKLKPESNMDYEDDVTAEGVERMRESVRNVVESKNWVAVDGFGRGRRSSTGE